MWTQDFETSREATGVKTRAKAVLEVPRQDSKTPAIPEEGTAGVNWKSFRRRVLYP